MLKRKFRNKNSYSLLQSSNRGSDISKPESTSLMVNQSKTETDELPKEITSVLLEGEGDLIGDVQRESSCLMKSLSQKIQSTPVKLLSSDDEFGENKKKGDASNGGRQLKCSSKVSASPKIPKDVYPVEKYEISYFEKVLKTCGASPLSGNFSYLMSEDEAIFSMKINDSLSGSNDDIARFLNSFKKEVEKPQGLQKMLAHTLTSDDCEVARGPVQESLMRMLLNVDCLQSQLIELLLQKMADIILNNEENESAQLVSSILRQMRFLNPFKEMKIAHKLFEILHVATINIQREIIFMLPEILSQDQMEEVSLQLVDMLKYENSLTNVIVDSVTNLHLSETVRSEIRSKILSRLDKCPAESLPSLVQFILNKCNEEDLTQVIHGLRENLPFSMKHAEMKKGKKQADEEDSYVKVTFEILKFSAVASKQMANAWIKIVSAVNSSSDFRCVDLMILIILFSNLRGRKSQILTLIRNKIRFSVLNDIHAISLFKTLTVVAADYFSALLEIASNLLKSVHQIIADFGAVLYKECFIHFHFYMKQNVINEISVHVGTGSPATVNSALSVLKDLCENHKEILCRHTVSVMGLLIKIPDLDPAQIRTLVDVIADLVFTEPDEVSGGWRDELQIFIQKQLASSKVEICKKGIVAAIMFGKHAGKRYGSADIDCEQINALLVTAMGSVETCEMKRAFFNDEFATVIHETPLNKSFLRFWSEKFHREIVQNLFVKNIDVACEHFPMSLQFFLHEQDGSKMVFPVVDFIVTSDSNKISSIPVAVIPSALRLLWCWEKDLKVIGPAFRASVIMPEVTVFDNFHTFDEDRKRIIMDCLFLCANYLIECVNAFCVHDAMDEALLRFKQLIYVRKCIGRHVHLALDYSPPFCQFYAPVRRIVKNKVEKSSKKGRKRKADDSSCNPSNNFPPESQIPTMSVPVPAPPPEEHLTEGEENDDTLLAYDGHFRQLHISCLKLLKTNLKNGTSKLINTNDLLLNENCWSSRSKEELPLLSDEALFILEDGIRKTKQILGRPERNFNLKSRTNFSTAEGTSPESFISDAIAILPALMKKIESWSSYCDELLKANEGIFDGPGIFAKDSRDAKLALAAGLKFLAEIICWQGFQKAANKSLLRDVITILSRNKVQMSANENSSVGFVGKAAEEAARCLARFAKSVLVLSGGISVVGAIRACFAHCTAIKSHGALVSDLCLEMLSRPWFTPATGARERGSIYNQQVDFLVRTYFSTVNNPLEAVKRIATTALNEIDQLSHKDSTLSTLKSISRNNFPLLYRAMCEALVSASTKQLAENGSDQFRLQIWSSIVEILMTLVNIVKIQSSRINLAALLKRSQSIIQLFFTDGLPAVELGLRVNSVEVLKLLKSFQTVTRFLHSICCHSKITSDSLVASYVPAIRAQCERLTLEVKGMLISNKIPMECITIAILKNKDLQGNDIISQDTVIDDPDEDSELPAEDGRESADEETADEIKFD